MKSQAWPSFTTAAAVTTAPHQQQQQWRQTAAVKAAWCCSRMSRGALLCPPTRMTYGCLSCRMPVVWGALWDTETSWCA